MKQSNTPKWLLTTTLLAILGANYSFQTTSVALHQQSGLFELSSTETEEASSQQSQMQPATTADQPKSATKQIEIKREGQVLATGTCADEACKNVLLSMTSLEAFVKNLSSVTAQTATASTATAQKAQAPAVPSTLTASTTASEDYDCDFTEDGKPETRSQKRERLKCIKQEKERAQREERMAKFEDKMDDIKDKCEDTYSESKVSCLSREFSTALSRFSGRNAISPAVAQRYFKGLVAVELNKALYKTDQNPEEMMTQIQEIIDGLPTEFSGLRKTVLDVIQNQARIRTSAINQQYKQAELVKNNPEAYVQTINEARQQQTELTQLTEAYSAAAQTSESFSSDSAFASYYQASYVPALRKMFSTIGLTTATDENSQIKPESTTRSTIRGRITSEDQPSLLPSTALPQSLDRGTRQKTNTGSSAPSVGSPTSSSWNFLNEQSGLRMGIPSSTSRGGTRSARPMGQ